MRSITNFDYYTMIVRKSGIDTTDMDSDKVMMDLEKGRYYVLNDVASQIWETIAKPNSIKNIIDVLMKNYDVNEKQCFDRTVEFLTKLQNEELISAN